MKRYIRTKEHGICEIIRESKHTLSFENSYLSGCLWKDDFEDRIQYADNVLKLIKVGDLTDKGFIDCIYEDGTIKICDLYWEIDDITKLYIKKCDNYMLVWDKERGLIK